MATKTSDSDLLPISSEVARKPGINTGSRVTTRLGALVLEKYSYAGYYFFVALLSTAIFAYVMKVWRIDPRVAINSTGDALFVQVLAKAVQDGWWWKIPSLSAPFGLELVDTGMACTVDFIFFKVFGLFTSEPGLIVNFYWFTSVALSAVAGAFCFNRMAINRKVAAVLGILFALSPWTYWRNTAHELLPLYPIPFCILVVYLLLSGAIQSQTRAMKRGLLFAFFLTGFFHTYIPFFVAFLTLTALIFRLVGGARDGSVRFATIGLLLLLFATLLNLAPTMVYRAEHGSVQESKQAFESEVYGLKLRQLITPTETNPFPPFRQLAKKVYEVPFQYEDENRMSQLGTTGTIGFFLLLGYSLLSLAKPRFLTLWPELCPLTFSVLAALLLATVGGFGTLFNIFVSPDIRCYNRISAFILYCCLAAVGVVVTRWISHHRDSAYFNSRVLTACLAVWLCFGIADQIPPSRTFLINAYDSDRLAFAGMEDFVGKIESRMSAGDAIFQLPYTSFIADMPPGNMVPYEHARAFLHSKKLRFSWGALKGRNGDWAQHTAAMPVAQMLGVLKAAGFSGLWVDTRGYSDRGVSIVTKLGQEGFTNAIRSSNDVLWFFDLRSFHERHRDRTTAIEMRDRASHPVEVVWGKEFYPEEHDQDGTRRWRWSKGSSSLDIRNPWRKPRQIALTMEATSLEPTPVPLHVLFQGRNETFPVSARGALVWLPLQLPPGATTKVRFEYGAKSRTVTGDSRQFGFAAINLVLTDAD